MSEWRDLTLGDLVREARGFIRTGPFGSQLHQSDYTEDPLGTAVVMPKDMVRGRVDRHSVSRVDGAILERLSAHQLASGDIVLARRGDVGRFAFIEDDEQGWLCGTGSMRVHAPDRSVVVSRFLRYALSHPQVSEWLSGQAIGATMPNLNASIVEALPLVLPDLATQKIVATTLSALDELIQINERRIEVLEDLARSLHREWFACFRFPGHETVAFVDSDLGPIPEGWEVKPCGEVLSMLGGGTPSKKEPAFWEDGVIPWFTPSDLTKARTRFAAEPESRITAAGLTASSARLFPAGSVLMTSRATLGVLSIATQDASCNQGFIVFPPDERFPASYIYEWLTVQADDLEMIATGATFKETKGALKRFPMLVPPPDFLLRFGEVAAPIEGEVEVLESKNRLLGATRDVLLPRLVTGQLDISDVDLGGLLPAGAA